MKRIVFTLGLVFALQAALMAQLTDQDSVIFNAHLLKTFNLNVDGIVQEITFATAADYNNGVVEAVGILPGTTVASVEATGNWNLQILAANFLPYVGPNGAGTGTIPINNLGVWVQTTGTHTIGAELVCPYISLATAMGMSTSNQMLINNGTGNAGDISDNAFIFHWQMGQAAACPNMNQLTMFDQLSAGTFGPGDFTTTAYLTLTEIP